VNNETRCLQPCDQVGKMDVCRAGRICVRYRADLSPAGGEAPLDPKNPCYTNDAEHKPLCFCSDGPDLTQDKGEVDECLRELLPYTLSVGRGFLVSGSQSGIPVTQLATSAGLCAPISTLDPNIPASVVSRLVSRIPVKDIPWCLPEADELHDGRCNPTEEPITDPPAPCTNENSLLYDQVKTSNRMSNPCLFMGGPNDTDLATQTVPRHVQALFRNSEIQFMMTNLETPLSSTFQLRFDVSGGFRPQTVVMPGTVELTMPARIVTSPINTLAAAGKMIGNDVVPYLFVVDQRRLGRAQGSSATRGQLLRIHPRGYALTTPKMGYQPIFEDLSHSGNLFPIQ
jgi:hypothetical protein